SGKGNKAEQMTKAACFENRYVVLGQRPFRVTALLCKLYTLRQAQGAWILSFFFALPAAFGICGATCLCSEGELAAQLRADLPLLG
ncbi:MAG: hypothetical protein IKQ23_03740, partial [Treponema sp.]|nr:hypothetical protein [Treponema sp.]